MPRLRVLLFIAAHLLALSPLAAQQGEPVRSDSVRPEERIDAQRPTARSPLLDAPVNRARYVLGPGDILSVSILGDVSRVYTLEVTPEGTVLVPSVGIVRVLGLNLDQAQEAVQRSVFRYFRNVDVGVSLTQVRSFKVFVLGDVPEPGVRVATSATRVSEVLDTSSFRRRNILLRRASGDTIRVDLARFLQMGDLSANPPLREGDALIVPGTDETITVYGRVHFPGAYEFRPRESLADLLSLTNGGGSFPASAADTIRLSRLTGADRREVTFLSRADALGAPGRDLVLRPFDVVYVPEVSNFLDHHTATVSGQVRRAGVYPIEPGVTTVQDLVEMAGGLTPEASLLQATLRRSSMDQVRRDVERLQALPPEMLSARERQILFLRSGSDENNVVVDFQALFAAEETARDQPVYDGDELRVPERREQVSVIGAVVRPGVLRHVPSQTVNQYVAQAGGFSHRAAKGDITIIKSGTGNRVDARDLRQLDVGDVIVVPFRPEVNWVERLQGASAVVGSITGLILTFVAVF